MISPLTLIQIILALSISWIRMTIALGLSIFFSIIVGVLAAINDYAEKIIIPTLDILQSIPILSFFPLALYAFMGLHPLIGPEIAAIFLIFTSQVWNIAFGVYESVRLLPRDLLDTSKSLGFGSIQRFIGLYLPASFPKIAANIPASWSNGLYFLAACEIISMGEKEVKLFGIGSLSADYILAGRYLEFWIGMIFVIVVVILTSILIFIPLMRLSERYRFEAYMGEVPRVWIERVTRPFGEAIRSAFMEASIPGYGRLSSIMESLVERVRAYKIHAITIILIISSAALLYYIPTVDYVSSSKLLLSGFQRLGVIKPLTMIGFSLLRVLVAISIAMAWAMPLSILIYEVRWLEKVAIPLLQVFASLPSSLLVPFIMRFVSDLNLPMEIGGVLIIVLGVQWYLFYFIYGAMRNVPSGEVEVCRLLRIRGLRLVKHLYLPRSLPSIIMGLMVAMGGGWNTLIIAERLSLDGHVWEVENPGIGKEISLAVSMNDQALLAAATIWMAGFVVLMNRLFWRRLHEMVVEKVRM